MAKRRATVLLMLAAMVMAAVPAGAQDMPIPRSYSQSSSNRAVQNKPADQVAAETATGDAAQAACAAGRQAACSDLGWAYSSGEGRPQNRPVAELIYRKACDAWEASACYRLGRLLQGLRAGDPAQIAADNRAAASMIVRGCQLGSLESCDAHADDLAGTTMGKPDRVASEKVRRKTCDAGWPASCRALASLLLGTDRTPAEQEEGLALRDRKCRAGDEFMCSDAEYHWRTTEGPTSARAATYLSLGCDAGDGWACANLAIAAMRQDPPDRAAALALFDRACPTIGSACEDAASLREEPQLTADCGRGAQDACITLGNRMAEHNGPLLNKPRALELLGAACDANARAGCFSAAMLLFDKFSDGGTAEPQRADTYLTRACEDGDKNACSVLADWLAKGSLLAQDVARAAELYAPQCDDGRGAACDFVIKLARSDPSAPALLATNYPPPMQTPEEIAAEQEAIRAEEERERAEEEARRCSTTTVEYEGVTYTDRMCDSVTAIMNGFAVPRIEQAPWQALLWRPARLGAKAIDVKDRSYCGGTLIATGWIITAAHCLVDHVDDVGKFPIEKHGYRVRLGVINAFSNEGNSYPIMRVIPHPAFKRGTLAFDIALVQYDPKAGARGENLFNAARINLDNRLPTQRPVVAGAPVYTFGWGVTKLDGPGSDGLRGARLELRDPRECAGVARTFGRESSVLCAAGTKGEQACFGDSGGPLITYAGQKGVPTLIGVVSGGKACGTTGVPSVYTRLGDPSVQTWLASHVPGFRSGQTAR